MKRTRNSVELVVDRGSLSQLRVSWCSCLPFPFCEWKGVNELVGKDFSFLYLAVMLN